MAGSDLRRPLTLITLIGVWLLGQRCPTATAAIDSAVFRRGNGYHSYEAMGARLKYFYHTFPEHTMLQSIGYSVQNRDLLVLTVAGQNPRHHVHLRPDIAFMGGIHGNEAVGKEILLELISLLLNGYGTDPNITRIMDTTRIHFLPLINPDGYVKSIPGDCEGIQGRKNAGGIDLNRNFLDKWNKSRPAPEPETRAITAWLDKQPLVLAANLHGGALVVNYPWDNSKDSRTVNYTAAPDDDVLITLALSYSLAHPRMRKAYPCGDDDNFDRGITNGAAWYPISGSLQDYQYAYRGTMALTLEVSCCKYPPAQELETLFRDNIPSLMTLAKEAQKGVKGRVLDKKTNETIPDAKLRIDNRDIFFYSSSMGEFWRILLPNFYILRVDAKGYLPAYANFTVPDEGHVVVEISLEPISDSFKSTSDDGDSYPTSDVNCPTLGGSVPVAGRLIAFLLALHAIFYL